MGKKFWGVVGAVLAALAAIAGVMSATVDPEAPDTNVAKALLRNYYPIAPTHPTQTWNKLTERYKASLSEDPKDPVGYREYAHYYGGFQSIDVDDVAPSDHRSGWFSARITYHWAGKPPSVSHQEFDLRCPWWTRYPLANCSGDNAQINATGFLPKKYW